jgi:RNA polymerase sigma factor (sigma-70 family)
VSGHLASELRIDRRGARRALAPREDRDVSQDRGWREGADVEPNEEFDDAALLLASARGEQTSFEAFYRRWLPIVTGFFLRRAGSREVAFNLTAETFAAIVVGCGEFDPARGSAPGWLFSIAEHKLRDSLRRGRVEAKARRALGHQAVVLEDEDLNRVEELASLGSAARLEELLGDLPAEQQAAVRARVLDERSYAAIAAELSCSQAVVRQRVHRGLRRLRERLLESP